MPWIAGFPREQLDWFPTIDPEKCVLCGMCMNCGKNVFDWTPKTVVVAHPYACQPGCSTCMNLCLGDAITFPDVSYIRDLYKREKIWPKVKKQLIADGKIPARENE